jgi:hypothetical protein
MAWAVREEVPEEDNFDEEGRGNRNLKRAA